MSRPSLPKRVFDFFIFTSLFIALCAVLMAWQTNLLSGLPFSPALAGFIFGGTVAGYNFHWYLTPPKEEEASLKLRWTLSNKTAHLLLFFLGGLLAFFNFLAIPHQWHWLLLSVFLTFLYSAPKLPYTPFTFLRRIAVGKTIFLAFAWTYVTAILPVVTVRSDMTNTEIIFAVNRFFFIYAICILFDYRDREEDRASGIRSMVTQLPEEGINRLFWSSLVVFIITILLLVSSFSLTVCLALFLPGLVLAFLYQRAKKNFSDYLYYFILDGLMMLSAPLVIFIKFAR